MHVGIGFGRRYRNRRTAKWRNPQPAIAHEGNMAALGPDRRVQHFAALRGRDRRDGPCILARDMREEQLPIDRHHHAARIGRPFVTDDAFQLADTRALALHFRGFRQFLAAAQLQRIDQHPPGACMTVKAPQIIAVAIVGPAAQRGQEPAVGRQLHPARHRAVDAGAGKHAIERERSSRGSHGGLPSGSGDGGDAGQKDGGEQRNRRVAHERPPRERHTEKRRPGRKPGRLFTFVA